jgi:hypothetical protein
MFLSLTLLICEPFAKKHNANLNTTSFEIHFLLLMVIRSRILVGFVSNCVSLEC